MPCTVCGQLLAVRNFDSDKLQTHLYCPQCEGLDIESQSVIESKAEYLINDSKLSAENIPRGLGEYNKHEVLGFLIHRINKHINRFFNKNGLYTFEFGHLASLIYSVYRAEGFGNKSISDQDEVWKSVTTLRDGFSKLHTAFLDSKHEFALCERNPGYSGSFRNFAQDYSLYASEYFFGFRRIITALVCGDPADWDTYTKVTENIRSFQDLRQTEDPETVEEYGDYWYQFINQLKAVASMDPMISEVYSTRMPDEVTIFQVRDFIEGLNKSLGPAQRKKASNGNWIILDERDIELAGKEAFGEYWKEVRPLVIVSENNLEAHPFVFQVDYTEAYESAERDETVSVKKSEYLYPRDYARLAMYQIFPLLRNKGTGDSGHEILKRMTEKRSDSYEEQFYEFLKEKADRCYLRPEISDSDGSEIDIIYLNNNEIHFVELKLFMPSIMMRSREGITTVNQKFDLEIFNEESEDSHRTPSGPTLPKKIERWLELESGDVFNADRAYGTKKDDEQLVENWWENTVRKFVVSNLTPTYVERDGIRFLTDFEYVRLIDEGDESVLYPIWDGRCEPNRV